MCFGDVVRVRYPDGEEPMVAGGILHVEPGHTTSQKDTEVVEFSPRANNRRV